MALLRIVFDVPFHRQRFTSTERLQRAPVASAAQTGSALKLEIDGFGSRVTRQNRASREKVRCFVAARLKYIGGIRMERRAHLCSFLNE